MAAAVAARAGGAFVPYTRPAPVPLDEKTYPIVWTSEEEVTYSRAIRIIKSNSDDLLPSKLAGLTSGEKYELVAQIDRLWKGTSFQYERIIEAAKMKDLLEIPTLNARLKPKLDTTNYAARYAKFGAIFFGIGALPGYLIGRNRNKTRDARNAESTRATRRDQSAHRREACYEIHKTEDVRIKEQFSLIEKRVREIKRTLTAFLESDGVMDVALIDEWREINKLLKGLDPALALTTASQRDFDTYLGRFKD